MFTKLLLLWFSSFYILPKSDGSTKIIGGTDAEDGQFPYQISLRFNGRHMCGGSILNSRWILTAAHCVHDLSPKNLTVVAGSNLLDTGGDFYGVENFVEHVKYNARLLKNDIAVMKTNETLRFGEKVGSIRLPPEDTTEGGLNCTFSGWGTTVVMVGGQTPNKLQTIILQTITNQDCYAKYYRLDLIGMLSSSNICTLNNEGEGACHGDSGGPLIYQDYQVGIVSWALPCARGRPDVFTRVYSYLDWIRNQTEDSI